MFAHRAEHLFRIEALRRGGPWHIRQEGYRLLDDTLTPDWALRDRIEGWREPPQFDEIVCWWQKP